MTSLLWISFIAAFLNVSVSQSTNPVESCISFSSSEEALLNVNWTKESVNLTSQRVSVRYQAVGGNVLRVISCFDEENIRGVDLFGDTADQSVEVSITQLDTCANNSLPRDVIGSTTATFGYISDVDTVLSEDNSSIIVTCSLACQTDFINGCSVTLSGCGEESTLSCTVNRSLAFKPRQCSVEFQNLSPTSYIYTANVMADVNMTLMREENMLSISGSFITSDPNNFSCEQPTSAPNITTTNATVPDDDGSSIDGNSSNPNNASDNNSTMTNGTITNDISNPIVNDTSDDDDDNVNPVTDSPITPTPTPSPNPPNENPSNSTQGSSDDEGFLEKIESLPVPVIASIGAFILIMIIVVTILVIVCCGMKRSSKQDKSKQHGTESGTDCASFTFQNSTQLLFRGHADSCSEVRSNDQSVITASSSIDQLPSYDHLEKPYQTKESTPISQGSSSRNSAVNNHMPSRDSSVSALDDELLDDFDYDEIEEPTNATASTQYNNLVHSGKEQRLKIDNPPAPSSTGAYERLSQPPADDNYAVPPEIDEVRKSRHEYEVPPDVNPSPNSEEQSTMSQNDATYDHLSPKLRNVYDKVGFGFQYDYPTNNSPTKNQYDTLLPKVPVVTEVSKPDSHSVVTQQPSLSKVQHSPGPLTGDMYTVPKKFEIKSSSSFHDYDTVADGFDGQSTMF